MTLYVTKSLIRIVNVISTVDGKHWAVHPLLHVCYEILTKTFAYNMVSIIIVISCGSLRIRQIYKFARNKHSSPNINYLHMPSGRITLVDFKNRTWSAVIQIIRRTTHNVVDVGRTKSKCSVLVSFTGAKVPRRRTSTRDIRIDSRPLFGDLLRKYTCGILWIRRIIYYRCTHEWLEVFRRASENEQWRYRRNMNKNKTARTRTTPPAVYKVVNKILCPQYN